MPNRSSRENRRDLNWTIPGLADSTMTLAIPPAQHLVKGEGFEKDPEFRIGIDWIRRSPPGSGLAHVMVYRRRVSIRCSLADALQ